MPYVWEAKLDAASAELAIRMLSKLVPPKLVITSIDTAPMAGKSNGLSSTKKLGFSICFGAHSLHKIAVTDWGRLDQSLDLTFVKATKKKMSTTKQVS